MNHHHRLRRGATALTSLALAVAGLAAVGVAAAPASQAAPVAVDDAVLTWDLNDEATSGAFAPGTWNLMSAGRIQDPGEGGTTLTTASGGAQWSNGRPAGWAAQAGDVTVQDLQADGTYTTATFAGTRTNTQGLNANVAGVRGETRLAFAGGTGTVDAAAGTATIAWDGDATLLAYSGMTFFHLSDPTLTVAADGTGTVTATVGGYATAMDDPTAWAPLPETEVTVATLRGVDVTTTGLTTTPVYREVTYEAPAGATPQNRTAATWGAFPQSFVDFQQRVGQGSYWYSSGGSADPRKVANPLSVAVDAEPVPAVTVSDTELLPSGAQEITVTGTGFDPALATGTRPPLAGRPGGAYVVFGKFAESWRPSQGAPGATRVNTSQKWALLSEDHGRVGGAAAGAIELTPAGTFTAVLTVDKDAVDAKATDAALVNYGVYTYAGSGATTAAYETYTPITFAKATPALAVTAPDRRYGQQPVVDVRVGSEGATDGTVTLRRGSAVVGTRPVTDGVARFTLPVTPAGMHALSASYGGSTTTAAATATGRLRVVRAVSATRFTVVRPTRTRAGRAAITVTSPTTTPAGRVTVTVRKASRVVRTSRVLLRSGRATAAVPRLAAGRYVLTVAYPASADVVGSSRAFTFTVR